MPLNVQSGRFACDGGVAAHDAYSDTDASWRSLGDTDAIRHGVDDADVCLTRRLAEIDHVLDRAPGPIRFRPLRRALWRALLLPVGDVLRMYRRQLDAARLACSPGEDHDAFEAMAYALVARAILGDVRAFALLADHIEGRPATRRPDAKSDPPPMNLEPIVRLLNERR